jgi:hypothetical protein
VSRRVALRPRQAASLSGAHCLVSFRALVSGGLLDLLRPRAHKRRGDRQILSEDRPRPRLS